MAQTAAIGGEGRKARRDGSLGYLVPAFLLIVIFFIVPVLMLLMRSVLEPEPGLQNYATLLGSTTYLRVFLNTFIVAGVVTAISIIVGYPVAWLLAIMPERWSRLVLAIVILSMWTNLLAVKIDGDGARLLVVQPRPGLGSGDRGFGQHDLLGFAQHELPIAADAGEVVTHEGQPRVGLEGRCGVVVELGEFELDEDQSGAEDGALLLNLLHQRTDLGVVGGDGELQAGVVADPAELVVERSDLVEEGRKLAGVEFAEATPVGLERLHIGGGRGQERFDALEFGGFQQRFEVPGDIVNGGGGSHGVQPTRG